MDLGAPTEFVPPTVGATVNFHQRRGIGTPKIDAPATVTAVDGSKVDLEGEDFTASSVDNIAFVQGGANAAYNYWFYPADDDDNG